MKSIVTIVGSSVCWFAAAPTALAQTTDNTTPSAEATKLEEVVVEAQAAGARIFRMYRSRSPHCRARNMDRLSSRLKHGAAELRAEPEHQRRVRCRPIRRSSFSGVGNNDYNDNAGATVGVYLDGVFLTAPAGKLLQMFDSGFRPSPARTARDAVRQEQHWRARSCSDSGEARRGHRPVGIHDDRQLRAERSRGSFDAAHSRRPVVQPRRDQHAKLVRLG